MSKAIVECVPNISEGRDLDKVNRIVDAARIEGVKILGVEPDPDYNRTVITFAGTIKEVENAATLLIEKAIEEIDMRMHSGEHPRMGCVDVCPFIPISNATMDDCVEVAIRVAKQIARSNVPVFLYGFASTSDERTLLSTLRKGEYEGLPARFNNSTEIHGDATRLPDFGSNQWDETSQRSGGITIGARDILLAYNVNIVDSDPYVAQQIGSIVRSSGRLIKSADGERKFRTKGLLQYVQGMGVPLESHKMSQVSMNLQNYRVTNLHQAYDTIESLCKNMGSSTKGSELVGLVPLEAMIAAGQWYGGNDQSDEECIETAIKHLGLDSISSFNPNERIIEWAIKEGSQ
ncbi:MAG: glutamate formimidoyltransferase [Euryarchaeota archaeon]|nr:glutamate formimidoyltransferase [Euryarchaeota archaeon]|tara:strand:- start:109 stop:1149 length:1041 start_codon:yes stop_codon:yes gene_type:complete